VDGAGLRVRHRAGLINGIADDIDDPSERAVADRHRNGPTGIGDLLPAHQTLAGVHRHRAHGRFPEMLGNLEHQAVAAVGGLERIEDRRQVLVELDVDHGADDLGDVSDRLGHIVLISDVCARPHKASAPEMISISSLVIIAWRVRL